MVILEYIGMSISTPSVEDDNLHRKNVLREIDEDMEKDLPSREPKMKRVRKGTS